MMLYIKLCALLEEREYAIAMCGVSAYNSSASWFVHEMSSNPNSCRRSILSCFNNHFIHFSRSSMVRLYSIVVLFLPAHSTHLLFHENMLHKFVVTDSIKICCCCLPAFTLWLRLVNSRIYQQLLGSYRSWATF